MEKGSIGIFPRCRYINGVLDKTNGSDRLDCIRDLVAVEKERKNGQNGFPSF